MIYCSSFRIRFSPTFNISVRQYRKLHEPNPPKSLQDIEEVREKFQKTQEYGLDKARFEFVSGLFGQIQSTWIFVWDILPWLWNLSGEWLTYAGYGTDHEVFLISFVQCLLILSKSIIIYIKIVVRITFLITI